MAVVNSPYVGIARGRLGEGVFSRVKGQTTLRGYNPSPANPRTGQQQTQRSQFSSAVKFFSRGVQNFFKFAFENKAEKESDYNAFMRYNANRGMYFGPLQNQEPEYPALGPFVMTKGSLPAPDFYTQDGDDVAATFFGPDAPSSGFATLGQLSRHLVSCGYQQGDIVTFVVISTDSIAGGPSEPVAELGNAPRWDIRQFTINTASNESLSSFGIDSARDPNLKLRVTMGQLMPDETIGACYVCVSRQTTSGLRVSSGELQLNSQARRAYLYGRSNVWRDLVLEAWKIQDLSVLQGSRSVNRAARVETNWVTSPELPTTVTQNQVLELYFSRDMTPEEIAGHLKVVDDDGAILDGSLAGTTVKFSQGESAEAPLIGRLEDGQADVFAIRAQAAGAGVVIRSLIWD